MTLQVMRILTRLNVGGPARQVLALQEEMRRLDVTTDLVVGLATTVEGDLAARFGFEDLTRLSTLQRSISPARDWSAYRALRARIRSRSPDVVHTHMAKAGLIGRVAARRNGTPVVVHTFHGHVLEGYFARSGQQAFIQAERWLARRTDALVAVSEKARDDLLALRIGRPEQWHVIPAGIDLAPFASGGDRRELRKAMGVTPSDFIVGIVGRLVPIKDLEVFVEAAARIGAREPSARFLVVGDGEERGRIESLGNRLLGDRIRVTGWLDDMPSVYDALDVVVLTSRNEGTPISLIEAGAAGKPVVATRVGGVPEVVQDGETGFLVEPADAAGIEAAVLRLHRDPDLGERMGEKARERALRRHSSRQLARSLKDLYETLLDRARRRAARADRRRV